MSSSNYRPLSPLYRLISAFLIVAHVVALQPVQIWAQAASAPSTPAPATPTSAANRPATPHSTPPLPVKAVVNMTKPLVKSVTAPPIGFSADPSDAEFAHCRLFAEPLLPIGGKTTPEENKALAGAILDFSADPSARNLDGLKSFVKAHPKSAWQVSLLTNLGIIARNGCNWSEALEDWQSAWKLGQKETDPTRSMIVDRALAQLAELTARVGRVKELKALLAEVGSRNVRGPGAELLAEARQSLFLEETEPDKSFRCGPLAAGKVWAVLNPGKPIPEEVFNSKCSADGSSLTQVRAFAKTLGMNFQMAKRSPGAPVLFPSIVNWKLGHYAAITGRHDSGLYAVKDATFSADFSVSEEILDREASGYFLVRTGDLPKGWQTVSEAEGNKVWGKGASSNNSKALPPCIGCILGCIGNNPNMAGYNIEASRVNLMLSDTPLYYTPPHGPAIEFTASYSQRDIAPSSTPNYPNLGSQWNFNWVSFVVDDPNNVATTTYGPGGGTLNYTGYTSTGANTGGFSTQALTQTILQRTSATSYIKYFPDGSRQVFNLADTSTPAHIYMTECDDPAGNVVSYTYDPSTFRLLSVTDSLGQVSTLAYVSNDPTTTNGDFYRVASVTDPFGRTATMTYDASGRLSQTTDMAGFASQYSYGAGDFIITLTTPYGNTTFVSNDSGSDRTLLATDPEGGSEYVWFVYNMNPPDAGGAVPSASGLLTSPSLNQYRTTYYWDKKAYMDAPGNFGAAHLYHFCHTPDLTAMSDITESEKSALESRIYYNYPGQTSAYASSNNNLPTKTARVLDDGTTQLMQMAYNSNGKPAMVATPGNATTPARTTTMTYAANGIDLVALYQENSAGQSVDRLGVAADLLGSFTYDLLGKHLVLTATDPSGQTTTFTYNSYGQILTATNAKNQTTTLT